MDPLQTFLTTLVSSLAWPIVVLVLGITFRKTLRAVLARVTGVEALGAKLQFAAEIKQLDLQNEQLADEDARASRKPREARSPGNGTSPDAGENARDGSASANDDPRERVLSDLFPPSGASPATSPEGMILSSWLRLENTLRSLSAVSPPPERRRLHTPLHMAQHLYSTGTISSQVFHLIDGLRHVRNEVVHKGVVPSDAEAAVFVGVINNIVSILERKTEELSAA